MGFLTMTSFMNGNLAPSASTNVREFGYATFDCEDTFTLEGVDFENVVNKRDGLRAYAKIFKVYQI